MRHDFVPNCGLAGINQGGILAETGKNKQGSENDGSILGKFTISGA